MLWELVNVSFFVTPSVVEECEWCQSEGERVKLHPPISTRAA